MALPLRPSPAALHPSEVSPKLNLTKVFKHLHCEATGPDQPLRFSMALPLKPYPPQRFIHQKLQPNPTKMFKHLHCEATGPDQPLRFSMALPLRPYHPQRFIHQKLKQNPTKMFKHLQCEAHRTRSAVAVQHGSSSQAFTAKPPDQISRCGSAWPFPEGHIPRSASSIRNPNPTKMFKHLQYEAHRTRSAFEVQHGSSSQALHAEPFGPDQPLRSSMALPMRPYHPQRFTQSRQKCSSIFNAKPAGPNQPLGFSMALPLKPSTRCPPDHISRWGSVWPFPLGHITCTASSIRSKSDSIVQASSTRSPPDQISR